MWPRGCRAANSLFEAVDSSKWRPVIGVLTSRHAAVARLEPSLRIVTTSIALSMFSVLSWKETLVYEPRSFAAEKHLHRSSPGLLLRSSRDTHHLVVYCSLLFVN